MSELKSGMADVRFLRLWDLYHNLLTANQREVTDLYLNYDLSLTEIAEQKGVSKQSVSDCLHKSRLQLESFEEKVGFSRFTQEEAGRRARRLAALRRWAEGMRAAHPDCAEALDELEALVQEDVGETVRI